MKFTRTLALIAGAALIITACSKGPDEANSAITENTNPLLAYVPADTAYVFAALEPAPKEITDVYVARAQPVLDVIAKQLMQFRAEYASGEYEDNHEAKLAAAVLDELGGSLSAGSLEKLGISMQSHLAFYAMGVFPVIRFELTDAQVLRDAIGRIETKMEFEMPVKEFNGTNYWRISEDSSPISVYIAILDNQLAISVFPVGAEDSMLAAFLGQEMPAQSMASSNALAIMNSEKGYTGYGSGLIDLQKLTNEFLNADSVTHTFLGPEIDFDPADLDAVCVAEVKSIVAKAPRITAGTTRLTANEIGMRYEVEIESSLASGLAALVSNTPAALDGDYLLSASLAVQIGKLRTFVLEKANEIVTTPYQCAELAELNKNAVELVQQLNIPMPPMVNNLNGVRVKLDDIDPSGDIPDAEGLLALHVDKPEMFVGMATMMVPGFEALDLPNQTEPVRIPEEVLQMDGFDVFALMGDSAIGVAMGEQHAGGLKEFMAAKPQNNGTFFSVSYDMAKQFEIQKALEEKYDMNAHSGHSFSNELSNAVQDSYTNIFDRSRVDMSLTGSGLIIDSGISFK